MRPTHRHVLELVLLLAAVRLGGVDLNSDSGHNRADAASATLMGDLH